MTQILSDDEVKKALEALSDWQLSNKKLHREFQFRDFIDAFGFMTRAAIEAEKMNHHPEWSNVYRTVVVDLTTHEAGGVTELDIRLAGIMDRLAGD